jgi:small subunit ribosomal protein S6
LRTYEALYIVRPDLKDDEIQTVADKVQSVVTDHGGAIVRSEIWGKRRLAYEVEHFMEGCYVLLRFEASKDVIPELENHFRLAEPVIRHLVVHFDEQTLRLEEEQRKRTEEQIKASTARNSRGGDDDDDDEPARPRAAEAEDEDE